MNNRGGISVIALLAWALVSPGVGAAEAPPLPPQLFGCTSPCVSQPSGVSATISNPFDRSGQAAGSNPAVDGATLALAQGEIEGRLIELNVAEPGTVMLTLEGQSGLPKDALDLRWLIEWYQSGSAGKAVKHAPGRKLVRELLVHNPELIRIDRATERNLIWIDNRRHVDVAELRTVRKKRSVDVAGQKIQDASTLQPFHAPGGRVSAYLKIAVPATQQPGIYREKLNLHLNGKRVSQTDITIRVLPFTLAASPVKHALYYRGTLDEFNASYVSSEYKSAKQIEADLNNLMEHGVTNATVYQDADNARLFREFMAIRERVGMRSDDLFYVGHPIRQTFFEKSGVIQRAWSNYNRLASLAKGKKIYIYGIDEAKGDGIAAQHQFWSQLRTANFLVMAAAHKQDIGNLIGKLDLAVIAYHPETAIAERSHRAGMQIYCYANPQAGIEDSLIYRENYGFPLWQNDYDGAMTYAYQHTEGTNIWNDFDSTEYRDHVFAYPTTDGVIDTIQWESYREAVDDLRYLQTFIDMLAAHGKQLPPNLRMDMERWLQHTKRQLPGSPQQVREALVEKILLIQATVDAR